MFSSVSVSFGQCRAPKAQFPKLFVGEENLHGFAQREPVIAVAFFSVDLRPVGSRKFVNKRERCSRKEFFQESVEPESVFGFARDEFLHLLEDGEIERLPDGRLFYATRA